MAFNARGKNQTNKCTGISRGKNHSARRVQFTFLPIVSVWGIAYINVPVTEQYTSKEIGERYLQHSSLNPCYSKWGPQTRIISIIWEPLRNADFWVPPYSHWTRICIVARSLADSMRELEKHCSGEYCLPTRCYGTIRCEWKTSKYGPSTASLLHLWDEENHSSRKRVPGKL